MKATCPSCGNDISDKAFDCPHCGHPLRKPRRGFFGFIFKWTLIAFNLFMLAWVVLAAQGTAEVIGTAQNAPEQFGATVGTAIGMSALLVIWLIGNVILGLPTILTRPRK